MILNDAQVTLPHGEVAYLLVSEYVVGPILLDVQAKIDAPDASPTTTKFWEYDQYFALVSAFSRQWR